MDPKPQGDMAGKGGQTHGSQGDLPKEREHGVKSSEAVGRNASGREVPDSKETSTEIAIEEGRKGRSEHPTTSPSGSIILRGVPPVWDSSLLISHSELRVKSPASVPTVSSP
jgi:hypothetical protein